MVLYFEGRLIPAEPNEPIGVALLKAGVTTLNFSPKFHRPRGIHCMRGTCASCHMMVNDQSNIPVCTTFPKEGMTVRRQNVWLHPKWDHFLHHFIPTSLNLNHSFTSSTIVNRLFLKLLRKLSGAGKFNPFPIQTIRTPLHFKEPISHHVDVAIVGGGSAGSGCYRALTNSGLQVVLIERSPHIQLNPSDNIWLDSEAIGFMDGALIVHHFNRLSRIEAKHIVIATDSYEPSIPFSGSDLPKIITLEAALKLKEYGISIEGSLLVISDSSHLPPFLENLGIQAVLPTTPTDASTINCPQFPIKSLEKIIYREGKSLKVIITHGSRSKIFQAPWVITHQPRVPDISLLSQIPGPNVWTSGSVRLDRDHNHSYDDGTRVAELIKNVLQQ